MVKILVVEDDKALNGLLCTCLRDNGYAVKACYDGDDALAALEESPYALIVTDIMMPKTDGFELARQVRLTDENTPILFMSAKDDKTSKMYGYKLGIDDYVTKPFSPKEVLARIGAVKRRGAIKTENRRVYKFEGLEVDMDGRNVYVDGEKAELTPKEYELLFYLIRNQGIALTREKLLLDVWGFDFYGDDRTVDTHVKMLRGNLKEYRKFIVTLRGLGYKFEA